MTRLFQAWMVGWALTMIVDMLDDHHAPTPEDLTRSLFDWPLRALRMLREWEPGRM